jgi:hypothetical protein
MDVLHDDGDNPIETWPFSADRQFKSGALQVPDETVRLMATEIQEVQRRLTGTCMFIGKLTGTDGIIILGTDLRVRGFGAEILLDNAKRCKTYVVKDSLARTKEG